VHARHCYKLDGDTLSLGIHAGGGKNRPTNFDVPKEDGFILLVLKRITE